MVHRPPDSRLLTNLLQHEKDYSKQLLFLLDLSHASLASVAAYASASPPPASHTIIAVTASFAGADEALRRYAASVDEWRAYLRTLKELEDEVGNTMRDREILVTRLIKASKQQRPTRDSLISGGSPSSSHFSVKDSASKLQLAQSELQACEARLSEQEHTLTQMRASAIQRGLMARCKAMVECGWTWGEMGKEGLRALEAQPTVAFPDTQFHKSLPDPSAPGSISDMSSLAPSQSASQLALDSLQSSIVASTSASFPTSAHSAPAVFQPFRPFQLDIGPAHSADEHSLPRVVSEEDDPGGSSAEDSDQAGPVEVHENTRLFNNASGISAGVGTTHTRVHFPTKSDVGPSATALPTQLRPRRTSFLSSIAGLFKKKDDSSSNVAPTSSSPSSGWHTRTDRNIARTSSSRRGSIRRDRNRDSSDEEDVIHAVINYGSLPRSLSQNQREAVLPASTDGESNKRLKKARSVKRPAEADERGWVSDGLAISSTGKGQQGHPDHVRRSSDDALPASIRKKPPKNARSSISGSSTLPRMPPTRAATIALPSPSQPSTAPKRASSLDYGKPKAGSTGGHRTSRGTLSETGWSLPASDPKVTSGANGHSSLMSIVEDVAAQNRTGWMNSTNTGQSLIEVKAPPRVSESDFAALTRSNSNTKNRRAPSPPTVSMTPPTPPEKSPAANLPRSTSAPSLPLSRSTPTQLVMPKPLPASGKQKMPLKSALRTRSPSPLAATVTSSASSHTQIQINTQTQPATERGRPTPVSPLTNVGGQISSDSGPSYLGDVTQNGNGRNRIGGGEKMDDDAASTTSSYATGLETFEDNEDTETEKEKEVPPPPPPHDHTFEHVHFSASTHDAISVSSDTASNTTPPVHGRRKSVRVSLQPTFSTTPPALEYDESSPWSNSPTSGAGPGLGLGSGREIGWESHANAREQKKDVWDDSSEEDGDYTRAKRLLSRASNSLAKARRGTL